MRTSFTLWMVGILAFAVLIGVAVYKLWPMLNPDITEIAPLDPECDLRAGPCTSRFTDGGKVSFGIEPRDVPVVKPLELEVRLDGLTARSVEVDFQGTDMNMGFNRVALKSTGDGRFVGDGMLPVCVRQVMEWEARVLLHTGEGLIAAPFRFITVTTGKAPPAH
jgi:hypothetical protein